MSKSLPNTIASRQRLVKGVANRAFQPPARPGIALPCIVALSAVWLAGCGGTAASEHSLVPLTAQARQSSAGTTDSQLRVEVPPPPFSDGVFPCTECHTEKDLPTNPTRRELVDAHDDIALKHDQEQRWCLDCHDAGDRDRLHLASGEPVPFSESYRLCGQCHGEKYRDWRSGVHGRRKGYWNGPKEYLLCVHCHDPHAPRFKALEPKPAPLRPMRAGR